MSNKLFVGNIAFSATEEDLRDLFSQAGPVEDVALINDKFTGKPRGFAFVTMANAEAAAAAISKFEGHSLEGRPLKVNEARPREERPFTPRGGGDSTGPRREGGFRPRSEPGSGGGPRREGGGFKPRGGGRFERGGERGGGRFPDRGGDRGFQDSY